MFDPISQVKHIADRMISIHTAELFDHAEECDRVENWLADDESKYQYRRELVFNSVLKLFGIECALQNNPPLSQQDWKKASILLQVALQQNLIPQLDLPESLSRERVAFLQMTSFIMNQYEYKECVAPKAGDVMLDCGACFGETAIWSGMRNIKTVYSFEPNPDSFIYLEKNAHRYDPQNNWMIPVPLAVSDTEKKIRFDNNSEHPGASCTSETGSIEVQATTLDIWCERNNVIPDFIKMDLEGDEVNALIGAEQIFRTHKPRFAICLYHQLSHMWEIPFLIKSYCPEYTFWCKKSAPSCEFVLFGMVPHTDALSR